MRNDTDDNLFEVERLRLTAEFFQRATRLSPGERDAFLEAGVPDSRMREDVRELLEARAASRRGTAEESSTYHDRRRAFAEQFARPSEEIGLPRQIGPYRIVRRLGTGSAGTVYEAEEDRPRRSVALKVLHPEMVSAAGLRRFEHEANALARVQHRGIAQIYAFGQNADSDHPQPYIALELVRGKYLNEHADSQRLGLSARIALFLRVCDAVQHAHERGVLHRDLKPSNIIVDAEGRPKVLDFSVACDAVNTAPRGSKRVFVGTLSYMSPEQGLGDPSDIDARTDVYALGVVGYQLLGGVLPLDLDSLPPTEAVRQMTEEWPKPLGEVRRSLRGDLTWIFCRALAKSKEERYASVAALASDLRRHLRNEPVLARPSAPLYLLTCFVRRYSVLVCAAALVLTAMAAGIVLAVRSAETARKFQRVAEAKTRESDRAAYAASLQVAADHADAHEERAARRILDQLSAEESPWEWRHVAAAIESDTLTVTLPYQGQSIAAWSPNGRWLADVRGGRRILVYDLQRRQESEGPAAPSGMSAAVGIDGSGTRIYWADEHGAVEVHDGAWHPLRAADGVVHQIVPSPDGKHVALAIRGRQSRWTVEFLDARSGAVAWAWEGKAPIERIDLDASGRRLAVGDGFGEVTVLDASSGATVWTAQLHSDRVTALRFAPDGGRIGSGSRDRTIRVASAADGTPLFRIELMDEGVPDLAFSTDGKRLASAHGEGVVRFWDLTSSEPRAAGRTAAVGATAQESRVSHLMWNDAARAVAALSRDALRLHAIDTVPAKPELRGHRGRAEGNANPYLSAVSFDPRGGAVASAGWDGTVRVWDTATNRERRVLEHGPGSVVLGCVYLKREGRLVSYSRVAYWSNPIVHLWDVDRGKQIGEWSCPQRIEGLAYAPLTDTLAILTGTQVRLLDAADLKPKGEVKTAPAPLMSLAFSSDGSLIFAGAESGTCFLIRANDTRPYRSWKGHQGAVRAADFDVTGTRLATVGERAGALRVWDVGTGGLEFENLGHIGLRSVRWSPDGTRLFTGSRHPAIVVHDATDGRALLALRGHRGSVDGLALTRDGAIMASASSDNTVRLWHTHSAAVRGDRMRRALADAER